MDNDDNNDDYKS